MLIIYRTNVGFEGDIARVDMDTPAAVQQMWAASNPESAADLDFIEVDETALATGVLDDLLASTRGYGKKHFYVAKDASGAMALMEETA